MIKISLLILALTYQLIGQTYGQMAIHDRAVVAQQERMVFKQWDRSRFLPRPNRVLGVPTNPNWLLTWAFHPDYPGLDRRPLSPAGEQTQRLGWAAAMKVSSDYYKKQADTLHNLAAREMIRISGALSGTDPLFLLYYKEELSPLDNIEDQAFQTAPEPLKEYMTWTGAYDWYLENMQSLAERYGLAKNLDMERGQRLLMYHRIMLEMRKLLDNWKYKLALSEKMLDFRESFERWDTESRKLQETGIKEDEIHTGILQKRIIMQ